LIIPATGSCRKDAGKSPNPAGEHGKYLEHGSSIPARIFPMLSNEGSSQKALEIVGIHREIPDRITASNFLVFSVANRPSPAVRHSPG